jgi:ketosteroid isomerase-like protein
MRLAFVSCLVTSTIVSASFAHAQQDTDAIKAANTGFYMAVSARDAEALQKVWSHEGQIFNIFAVSKAPMLGWSAVKSGYDDLFKRFAELSVSMPEPAVRQDGAIAIVVGVETQKAKLPNGDTINALLPATNVFIKRDGQWLMVHHHSSRPPQ